MTLFRVALLAVISALTVGALAQAQELPEGQGKALLQTTCTQCHGVDVIVSQPRSREGWTDVVSRMVGNGAQLNDDDYILVIEYLTTHLGLSGPGATEVHSTSVAPAAMHGK